MRKCQAVKLCLSAHRDESIMSNPVNAIGLGLIAAVAAVAGLVAASFVFTPDGPNTIDGGVKVQSGTLLPSPRAIPPFALQGSDGQAFDKARLTNHWSVIFVGFTHCPDICPNTLGLLKTVHGQLAAQHKPLQVVLLSVDPERDTVEALRRYVTYFDPGFLGATGSRDELDKLGAAIGFVYLKSPGATPDSYTVDHSSALILVNPDGQVAGYFTQPLRVEALVADLGKLIPSAS